MSAQVVFETWRAAGCRPYIENVSFLLKFCVTVLILCSKNAKNAVPYRRGGNLPPATLQIQPVWLNRTTPCSGGNLPPLAVRPLVVHLNL